MSSTMTAEDLRTLATALDQLSTATRQTGVRIEGYQPHFVRLGEMQLAIDWVKDDDAKDDQAGQYVVEIPESSY